MNQYDDMKKMMKISRRGVIRQILKEEDQGINNQQQKRQLTSSELQNEQAQFANNVTKLTQFKDFQINYDNVTWGGFMPKEKIEWVYSLESDDAVYISCELTQLTQSTLELIQKLYGYYTKWADQWSGEIGVKGSGNQTPDNNAQPQQQTGEAGPPPEPVRS